MNRRVYKTPSLIKGTLKVIPAGRDNPRAAGARLKGGRGAAVDRGRYFQNYNKVYLASQIKMNDTGFLSSDITVRDLISHRGDVHHLFPKNYLKTYGLTKGKYNQIANYVMMQSEINIAITDRAPSEYFTELINHANDGKAAYGAITDIVKMKENFAMHCIPDSMENKNIEHYEEFLSERRHLMAQKIREYYAQL